MNPLRSGSPLPPEELPPVWHRVTIQCVTCSGDFELRERIGQGFRFHRCADCAAAILAKKIADGLHPKVVLRPPAKPFSISRPDVHSIAAHSDGVSRGLRRPGVLEIERRAEELIASGDLVPANPFEGVKLLVLGDHVSVVAGKPKS